MAIEHPEAGAVTYYVPVGKEVDGNATTNENDLLNPTDPTKKAGAYWELQQDGVNAEGKSWWKPTKLFIRAGLTVVNGALYELSPSVATINGVAVHTPSTETPTMGTIPDGGAYGAAAVRIGDSDEYYVMTSGTGWQRAGRYGCRRWPRLAIWPARAASRTRP